MMGRIGWSRPVLLLLLAAVSALWVLAAALLHIEAPVLPNTASTTLLFLAAVALRSGVPSRYRWSIVGGLGFSAVGDAFLAASGDRFMPGLGSFLIAHVCYLSAFTSDSRPAEHKLPFLAWSAAGAALMFLLWPGVPVAQRVPVVLYTAALLAMASQAASRALALKNAAAILAALGGALFVVSDSVLAFQRFRHPVEAGRLIVLGTYFAAQAGISLSVFASEFTIAEPPLRPGAHKSAPFGSRTS